MAKIYAIINQKGGVAKTTTTAYIGAGLKKKGHKVLFIDLDPQGNLTDILGLIDPPTTIYEVLKENLDIKKAIYKTSEGDLIASSKYLAVEGLLIDTGKEYKLKEAIEPILSNYDYVLIDCPPSLNVLTTNALTACNECIITSQADRFSLEAIKQLHETLKIIKQYTNPLIEINGILLTRYNKRTILTRDFTDMLEQLANELNTKVYKTKIRETISIKEAQAYRVNVFDYDPKSNGAIDYMNLVNEILRG